MSTIYIDLAKAPADEIAATGYDHLYRLWKANQDSFAAGHYLSESEFSHWLSEVRTHMTERERLFFDEPYETRVKRIPEWLQVQAAGRIYKMLMDRQGYRVSKENGGLG